ncbi:hypothetical protein Ais01nite_79180 [Asanoa ishikariensis]|uniref:Uncharacterized protein n=1 Tax=Asanoa ishikariensis TaxID=137265 RepID=A0A1H3KHG9_9ACTN|nr:hypothetical protein [Asanoa ishikariensis]GIF69883.1 hypothetical protein Ais01nite_79180 [Asanoa ishikariensis]SDY51597.1 hypothetical protein SAMN05421684_0148 [Asanoa ishikariensis]
MSKETPDSSLGRRRLLRRAGTVAAGVVGAGAVSAAVAAPAQAAPGDPVVQGENNNGNTADPLVTLNNPGGPALNLAPSGEIAPDAPVGSLRVDGAGNIWTLAVPGLPEMVHTSFTATQLVPILPERVLNTRTAEGRANVINQAGNFDSAGRLLSGKTIHVYVGDLAFNAVALHGNLTVTAALGDGYLTLWPGGAPRPATSVINYAASTKLNALANHVVSGIGVNGDTPDVISIFNSGNAAHVLLDISAFTIIWGFSAVFADTGAGAAAARISAAAAAKPMSRMAKRTDGKAVWDK